MESNYSRPCNFFVGNSYHKLESIAFFGTFDVKYLSLIQLKQLELMKNLVMRFWTKFCIGVPTTILVVLNLIKMHSNANFDLDKKMHSFHFEANCSQHQFLFIYHFYFFMKAEIRDGMSTTRSQLHRNKNCKHGKKNNMFKSSYQIFV